MTQAELKALAEKILAQTGPSVIGSAAWFRAHAVELSRGVLELLEEMRQDAMDRNLAD